MFTRPGAEPGLFSSKKSKMVKDNIDLKKWALEYALRIPNNGLKHPIPQHFGNIPQNIPAQTTTEIIIKEANKILNYLNGKD